MEQFVKNRQNKYKIFTILRLVIQYYYKTIEEWCNVNGYNHLISDKEYYEVICSNGVYINK